MRNNPLKVFGFVGLLSLALASEARAQATQDAASPPEDGWRLDLGATVLAYPLYPGSKSERILPLPSIEAHYGDRFFASLREGIGYNLFRWNGLVAGPVANFAFPRYESDKRAALRGLGDVDLTLEAGGFVRYDLGRYATARVEALQGLNGPQGLMLDTSLALHAPPLLNDRLFLSAGPRLAYYDHSYAQAYFGITPNQSEQSGYAPFRPEDGFKASAGLAAAYLVTDRVTWTVFGDYGRFFGDITDSPILRGAYGSRNQYTVGSALTYRFDFGN
jgi:outer membrane protein